MPRHPTQLSAVDPRIPAKCREFFPASPEFAAWLAERTVQLRASVEFARILCFSLRECFPDAVVAAEAVQRLAVDGDLEAIGRINRAHDNIFAVCFAAMVFLTRISGTIEAPDGAQTMDDLTVRRRPSIDASKRMKGAYCRLWYCAYGMLAGVAIDPRIDDGVRSGAPPANARPKTKPKRV